MSCDTSTRRHQPNQAVSETRLPQEKPGAAPYVHPAALQAGGRPLWGCKGACDALALLAAGVPCVVALFGVQGWRWDWVRRVSDLVFALDADTAGQQQWRQFARQAVLRGKRVAVLPAAAYGGCKDVSEAWATGVLAVGAGPRAAPGGEALRVPPHQRESWAERIAILVIDGGLPHEEAERLARAGLQTPGTAP